MGPCFPIVFQRIWSIKPTSNFFNVSLWLFVKYCYENLIIKLKIPGQSYDNMPYISFPIFSLLFLFGGAAAPPAP